MLNRTLLRFLFSAMVLVVLFAVISAKTAPDCYDCSAPYGFPFAYYNEGGWGGAGVIWTGLAGDVALVIIGAGLIAAGWDFLSRKVSRNGVHVRG